MSKYKIGDSVWLARAGVETVRKTCEICFGNRVAHLTLGNGEVLEVACKYCDVGFSGSLGYRNEYEYTTEPQLFTIDGIESEINENGEKIRYRSASYILDEDKIYTEREDAEKEGKLIASKKEKEEFEKTKYIKHEQGKSFTWNAGYYKRKIKDAEKEIEYANRKMKVCKERAK